MSQNDPIKTATMNAQRDQAPATGGSDAVKSASGAQGSATRWVVRLRRHEDDVMLDLGREDLD